MNSRPISNEDEGKEIKSEKKANFDFKLEICYSFVILRGCISTKLTNYEYEMSYIGKS